MALLGAQRKGVSSTLRRGYWFTAGLAAFVVVCLIAAFAGESVHTSTASLLQQTPVVKGGKVAGEQVRRSAMSTVESVASTFKNNWEEVAQDNTDSSVFSKQLKDLHSANGHRAVRLMQATGDLIERPCAPTTTVKVARQRTSGKCYYPAPPGNNTGGLACVICLSGTTGYFATEGQANSSIAFGACKNWLSAAASIYLFAPNPDVVAFGQAILNINITVQTCSAKLVNGSYVIANGPYCVKESEIQTSYTQLAGLEYNSADYKAKLAQIQAAAQATCPPATNADEVLDNAYAASSVVRICNFDPITEVPNPNFPANITNLASGCDQLTTRR